ncbi:YegP family protein [Pasteurella multocida]|uniref:YegP family protein n=1 Tax=Pasteurella multocida TaxID=747 RepID=UPI0038FC4821
MKFETYLDACDEWRWRLRASNGKIIADSGEGYKLYFDCLHGIDLVRQTNQFTDIICLEDKN